jgi:aminoglycoside phosphotransferase (APT) family kinase protein
MMHVDELMADEEAVFRLIAAQAPEWAGLAISPLASTGTDNWLFRLGNSQVLRLPRRPSAIALMAKELDWLPHLQGLPLDVPHLRVRGHADLGTPCEFGIFDWMDGEIASADAIANWADAAQALARFLLSLQAKSTVDAPRAGPLNSRRGVPLHDLNDITLSSIDTLCDEIDVSAAKALWHQGLNSPYAGPGVWLHGDLKADNLIARHGALAGVIDWGLAAVGDPAADYASAWSWVDPSAREIFRMDCALTDSDWCRAKAWALYGAVIALSYYRGGRNDALCRQSRQTLLRLGLLL